MPQVRKDPLTELWLIKFAFQDIERFNVPVIALLAPGIVAFPCAGILTLYGVELIFPTVKRIGIDAFAPPVVVAAYAV